MKNKKINLPLVDLSSSILPASAQPAALLLSANSRSCFFFHCILYLLKIMIKDHGNLVPQVQEKELTCNCAIANPHSKKCQRSKKKTYFTRVFHAKTQPLSIITSYKIIKFEENESTIPDHFSGSVHLPFA